VSELHRPALGERPGPHALVEEFDRPGARRFAARRREIRVAGRLPKNPAGTMQNAEVRMQTAQDLRTAVAAFCIPHSAF
jgi:hypothetical protein